MGIEKAPSFSRLANNCPARHDISSKSIKSFDHFSRLITNNNYFSLNPLPHLYFSSFTTNLLANGKCNPCMHEPQFQPPFKLLYSDYTPKVLLTAGKSLACFNPTSTSPVKLFFWDGTTKVLKGKQLAGELMFQFPDKIICHADSFFIGRPIQPLSIDDRLEKGQTYFVLPVEPFAGQVLSTTSLAALSPTPKRGPPIGSCNQPFQYIKGNNGRMMIKVCPEFMMRLMRGVSEEGYDSCSSSPNSSKSDLCSTPELQKQYKLLVGSRVQVWSPKLETIKECRKAGTSPSRLLRLEWRPKKA